MKTFTSLFHQISYLQYPFYLAGLIYVIKPFSYIFSDPEGSWDRMLSDFQMTMVLYGIGISFSTLQDTSKTQNNFSKKIWQNPRKGKMMLVTLATFMFILFILGIIGLFASPGQTLHDISMGLIVFGIGMLGMLKTAIEMFENHRLDKLPSTDSIS